MAPLIVFYILPKLLADIRHFSDIYTIYFTTIKEMMLLIYKINLKKERLYCSSLTQIVQYIVQVPKWQ